jgi:hypothetical protein
MHAVFELEAELELELELGLGDFAMTKVFSQAAIRAVLAISLTAVSTSSYAFSSEAQKMCTGDAFRLCSADIPDVSKITACMMQHRASLSAGCRTVMDRDLAQNANKVASK